MMHQGRVISRTELVEHLYDQDFDRDSNTIEVFIGRVRKKIGPDASRRCAAWATASASRRDRRRLAAAAAAARGRCVLEHGLGH